MQGLWFNLIKTAHWKAFCDIVIASNVRLGIQSLLLVCVLTIL